MNNNSTNSNYGGNTLTDTIAKNEKSGMFDVLPGGEPRPIATKSHANVKSYNSKQHLASLVPFQKPSHNAIKMSKIDLEQRYKFVQLFNKIQNNTVKLSCIHPTNVTIIILART